MKQPSASSDVVGTGRTGEVRMGESEVLGMLADERADMVSSSTGGRGDGGGVSNIFWYLERALLADARNSSTQLAVSGVLSPPPLSPPLVKVVFPLVTPASPD